jgi:hypothetical protein
MRAKINKGVNVSRKHPKDFNLGGKKIASSAGKDNNAHNIYRSL